MRILIIKTGEIETFDLENRVRMVSLGDVLRTTVLAHAVGDLTWYVSDESRRLLAGQSITEKIDPTLYDYVLNLENDEEIFSHLKNNTLGFFKKNHLRLLSGEEFELREFLQTFSHLNWPEKLFKLLNRSWQQERPLLKVVNTKRSKDVGLNWKVGPKWPAKDWGKEKWVGVYELISQEFKVSWQEGFDDLEAYISWISQHKVILTHDSLGLHIAQALKIPVIALFGPTSSKEIPLYEEDIFLNFQEDPYLTSSRIDEILKSVLLRSENESSVRRK